MTSRPEQGRSTFRGPPTGVRYTDLHSETGSADVRRHPACRGLPGTRVMVPWRFYSAV
jgi:hypothetical protein